MSLKEQIVSVAPARHILPVSGRRPITIIANEAILAGLDENCLAQAMNGASAPYVDRLVVNPDAHTGYGVPVGCVLASKGAIFPAPVGPDIKCSMSFLQTELPAVLLADLDARRALIQAICERIPTGANNRQAAKGRRFSRETLRDVAIHGATPEILTKLGIPPSWIEACEDARHGNPEELAARLQVVCAANPRLEPTLASLASYGSGNHFGEAEVVTVAPAQAEIAKRFGLKDGCVGFLSHCGSRGFGYKLADAHFKGLAAKFKLWGTPLPGGDEHMVYAPLGTPEATAYLADMALGANFATVNHLLINALVHEAFCEIFPGTNADLVYYIAHNIARQEIVDGTKMWVIRKGATRAFPAGHHELRGTRYFETGHPILLPGNPTAGSHVMVANAGAAHSLYSINHGAGRAMGRKQAERTLSRADVDAGLLAADVISNCRVYPIDEAPAAYKDFDAVTDSVTQADLATSVAKLRALFVIKDGDKDPEGSA
jgi:tRNA-splicing ligase RtcB